jgi:hypothetical protein
MNSPVGSESSFTIKINNINIPITSVLLSSEDPKRIILNIFQNIIPGDKVTIQYNGSSLTSSDGGILQPFGPEEVYNTSNELKVQAIPGKIQAEDYSDMFGVQTENTTDAGGGLNVGWIDTGDWMDYNVDVANTGSYTVTYRIAALSSSGNITLKSDGQNLNSVDLPITSGWQNWQSVSRTIDLSEGQHTLRLEATRGGFNVNWFSFDAITKVESTDNPHEFYLSQNYPNPFNPNTIIEFEIPNRQMVRLKVFDLLGNEIQELLNEVKDSGQYKIEFKTTNLTSGIYMYRLQTEEFIVMKKMILLR